MWGIASIDNDDPITWDTSIESFFEVISEEDAYVYFHNLKFDGGFMLDYLLRNGFTELDEDAKLTEMGIKSVVTDMNKFYAIEVMFENGVVVEFRDSLKKLPMSAANVAESFKLPVSKGSIDYHKPRPIGYEPTDDEIEYLENDLLIIAMALRQVFASGMTRLTVASDSLAEYKRLNSTQWFNRTFPTLSFEMDAEIRRGYRGGFTYVAERYKDRRLGAGLVLDVNSLYPAVMYNTQLPYGEPIYKDGKVTPTITHPLDLFSVTFTARLKPDHVPCIQLKGSSIFGGTEYLSVIDEPATLMVTGIDWALYNDHYDIDVLSYNGGWLFKGTRGLFDTYIDKWAAVKAAATGGSREIAKLHLNSLYGKFGSNPNITGKHPILDEETNAVRLVRGPDKMKAPVYTAIAVFVTSYARDLTIRAAQANYKNFIYADTDSLHLLLDDEWTGEYTDPKTGLVVKVPGNITIHPSDMGAWKYEYSFVEGHYLRAKSYLDKKADGTYKVAFAGVPVDVQQTMTFDTIVGDSFTLVGKKEHHVVPGGVVLRDKPYTFVRNV